MLDSLPDSLATILAIGFTILIIIVGLIHKQREKQANIKRSADFKKFCENNNCKYSGSMSVIPRSVTKFSCFRNKVKELEYLNIIYGNRDGINYYIIDRKYITGYGRDNRVRPENCWVIHDKRMSFPQFFMREEYGLFDNVGKVLGGQDIDFDSDPAFSNKFVLQGANESAVREFFRDNIRRVFVENHHRGYCYEAGSDCFMVQTMQYSSDIQSMMKLLNYSLKLYKEMIEEIEPS